jgi:hypothetical protein
MYLLFTNVLGKKYGIFTGQRIKSTFSRFSRLDTDKSLYAQTVNKIYSTYMGDFWQCHFWTGESADEPGDWATAQPVDVAAGDRRHHQQAQAGASRQGTASA